MDDAQNYKLHVKQIDVRERVLSEVQQLLDVRREVLLNLAGHVEGRDADQLQLVRLHVPLVEDRVEERYGGVEGLLRELEIVLDLGIIGSRSGQDIPGNIKRSTFTWMIQSTRMALMSPVMLLSWR